MQETKAFADLHTHTTCSDGVLSPAALVEKAADRGLRVLSVTDHDTVEGQSAARRTAEEYDLTYVAGVELSVTVGDREVHLLAYDLDPSHRGLRDHLEYMAKGRQERARRMIDLLREEGVDVYDEELAAAISSNASVGRPHVASALVRGGYVETTRQAFEQYLARDRPAFIEKPEAPANEILEIVHAAAGVGVLAHPGHWIPSECIRELVDAGLDGIEIRHPSHDRSLQQYYHQLARGYGLLQTGGSDYHGWMDEDDEHLGRVGLSRRQWERFWEGVS